MTPIEIVLIVLAVLVGIVALRFLLAFALFGLALLLTGIAGSLDKRAARKLRARGR